MELLMIAATKVRDIPEAIGELDVDVIADWVFTGILIYGAIILVSVVGAGLFIWWLSRQY
jgi:hypothetical protein